MAMAPVERALIKHADEANLYWFFACLRARQRRCGTFRTSQRVRRPWRNIFAFDYRGFGDSAGARPSKGCMTMRPAYRYLIRTERVSSMRIILAGQSLGSAVAVDLATRVPAAGLLLFAPIDSVPAVAARVYPWAPARLLSSYQFNSYAKASAIDLPVVMFHGWPDSYMRQSDARLLLEQFRGPKLMAKTGGGHHHAGFDDAVRMSWRSSGGRKPKLRSDTHTPRRTGEQEEHFQTPELLSGFCI
jgi:pimeloyl-ACP methyl ester carboxylesterase